MAVEYRVRFENGSMTITPITGPTNSYGTVQPIASQGVVKSHQLGASFGAGTGGGGNPETGPGGGGNPETGPGGGGNPETGPGGGGNPETGPGGRAVGPRASTPPYVGTSFQMETQCESEWCWAAVSSSVDHYFQPGSYSTQCGIASQVIPGNCCEHPDRFDQPEMLQDALDAVGRLRGITGLLTFDQLQAEINADHPVCIRIAWDDGGAHYVALTGYQVLTSGVRTVDVADPFYANSTEDFDMFPSYYHGGGRWTASFLTK